MKRLLGGTWRGGSVKVAGRWLDSEERTFLGDYARIRDAIRKMIDYAVLTLGEPGGEVQVEGRVAQDSNHSNSGDQFHLVEVSVVSARRSFSQDGNASATAGMGGTFVQKPPTPGFTGGSNCFSNRMPDLPTPCSAGKRPVPRTWEQHGPEFRRKRDMARCCAVSGREDGRGSFCSGERRRLHSDVVDVRIEASTSPHKSRRLTEDEGISPESPVLSTSEIIDPKRLR